MTVHHDYCPECGRYIACVMVETAAGMQPVLSRHKRRARVVQGYGPRRRIVELLSDRQCGGSGKEVTLP